MDANSSAFAFTSVLAGSKHGTINVHTQLDTVVGAVNALSLWAMLSTIFAICVSMNPKFEEYYAKWASGPLSCVSVFH
ncbi:hypothetical protein E4U55_000915, partial [Claviceps digitariae]